MNQQSEKTLPFIPEFLNEPEKFIRWTVGELCVFLGPLFVIGFFFSWILGFILGCILYKALKTLTAGPYGNLFAAADYWFMPFSRRRYKAIAPSHIKEWVG